MKCAIVMTTIYDPVLLAGYRDNFAEHGHLDDVTVYVIPDRKTPPAVFRRCEALAARGLRTRCPDLAEQDAYLARLGCEGLVPYDSDNRRNVGFLMAIESDADFMISLDDDNYCRDGEDFFAAHGVVAGDGQPCEVVNSSSGWVNVCEMLRLAPSRPVYPRGFPYHRRHEAAEAAVERQWCTVRMNAGLWLGEPDLDAMTWLVCPVRATGFDGRSVVLGPRAWSPINTQNTALAREVIPSYYFLRMGYPLGGMPIDRYGDIFSGYFSQACVRHLGAAVRVGTPAAEHKRNSHNYMRDAANEFACVQALEELTAWLPTARLEGATYIEAYRSLSYALEEAVERFSGGIWTYATRGYFHQAAYHMRQWAAACEKLLGAAVAV
jgi:hypothetical protein